MTLAGDRAGTAFTGLSALAGCGGCAAKAPPEVLEESRERKAELEARKAKVDEALARLG